MGRIESIVFEDEIVLYWEKAADVRVSGRILSHNRLLPANTLILLTMIFLLWTDSDPQVRHPWQKPYMQSSTSTRSLIPFSGAVSALLFWFLSKDNLKHRHCPLIHRLFLFSLHVPEE